MWISAMLHWLVVSPGMHEQARFPWRLFLARLPILSPLLWWALFDPAYARTVGAVCGAIIVAIVADLVIIHLQADAQVAWSSGRKWR